MVTFMDYFKKLCEIPHGSYNTKAISDYCVSFAKEHGLNYVQDEAENVIIYKDATPGYEDVPKIMLQGHLDMVCEKEKDLDFDFTKDPLKLIEKDGMLKADGTTLGGDDGIAIAYCLQILADNNLKHPALECVFTTQEEVGMDGANALDSSNLSAKYLINIDNEVEGEILVGCAGGIHASAVFPVDTVIREGNLVKLELEGLRGGHSGSEIHSNRVNAVKTMARILVMLSEKVDYDLISVKGGLKDNAIPRDAVAYLVVDTDDIGILSGAIDEIRDILVSEMYTKEPNMVLSCEIDEKIGEYDVLKKTLLSKLLFVLDSCPNGVQEMSADLPGMVESSLNLGILEFTPELIQIVWLIRSSKETYMKYISDKLEWLVSMFGGQYIISGQYPSWDYKIGSKLQELSKETYKEMYGKEPVLTSIHAGLECGIFSDKMPGIDIISIGPTMPDIHTPEERIYIDSANRVYDYIIKLLENTIAWRNV